MKLCKLLISVLLLPILFTQGYSFSFTLRGEIQEMAKTYADKKYNSDFKVMGSMSEGYTVILAKYQSTGLFTKKELYKCTVQIGNVVKGRNVENINYSNVTNLDGNLNVIGSDCGMAELNYKQQKLFKKKILSRYFKHTSISSGMAPGKIYESLIHTARKRGKNNDIYSYAICDSKTVNSIFSKDWDLPITDWLEKYRDCLEVGDVTINIFQEQKSPENIAKAVELAYEFNKYLYNITGTHKVKGIDIYLYGVTQDYFENTLKSYHRKFLRINTKQDNTKEIVYQYNYLAKVSLGGCIYVDKKLGNGNIISVCSNKYLNTKDYNSLDILNHVELATKNNKRNIKSTKYFQEVERILKQADFIK